MTDFIHLVEERGCKLINSNNMS